MYNMHMPQVVLTQYITLSRVLSLVGTRGWLSFLFVRTIGVDTVDRFTDDFRAYRWLGIFSSLFISFIQAVD